VTDADLEALDPTLAEAYAAERRVTDATIAAAGITRDRLLVAALARTARTRTEAASPRRASVRRPWLIAAAAIACVSLGYAAGRIIAPAAPQPPKDERVPGQMATTQAPLDAAVDTPPPADAPVPIDAGVPVVRPAPVPPAVS
jgi:hypothetical protein